MYSLDNQALRINGIDLLTGCGDETVILPDPLEVGVFLRFVAPKSLSRHVFAIGRLTGMRRFTCCHRYEPYWMKAAAGTSGSEVPIETQYLLAERANGDCVLIVPLIDGAFRASVQGTETDGLELVAESGDPGTVTSEVVGLFVAAASDPFALLSDAAHSVNSFMGIGRLRTEKPLPDFVDQFGWCTWDAFYQEVSLEKMRTGLESFREGGVQPRLLILDDGWQSQHAMPSGEKRMTAFAANEKFPGDLAPTVAMAKQEFGIETFLVWHALNGYWGGVDGESLPGYGVRSTARSFSPGILHYCPNFDTAWWGAIVGVVPPEHIYRFFQDYHRHLRAQGVDGVKVDTQATLEGVAYGFGGRVELMRRYHEALEGSVHTHFRGALINCMSCAAEMLYGALNSTITRTSTDFWPDRPASHGLHLYVNAQVSAWFGEFVHPDWDMFQSGHAMGAFHAAGRAVGGCPIYVSDKPGAHDFDLLRKLVLPDGTILRADEPGRPTRDCLFHDPTKEDVLLKIFNRNVDSGIVGAFNARYAPTQEDADSTREPNPVHSITGTVSPKDVEGLVGDYFAVYAHHAQELRLLEAVEPWAITLEPLTCELFTIVPVDRSIAPIGLVDMFNSAGAIVDKGFDRQGVYQATLRSGGHFLAWSESKPNHIALDEEPIDFSFDASTHRLEVSVPGATPCVLRIVFD